MLFKKSNTHLCMKWFQVSSLTTMVLFPGLFPPNQFHIFSFMYLKETFLQLKCDNKIILEAFITVCEYLNLNLNIFSGELSFLDDRLSLSLVLSLCIFYVWTTVMPFSRVSQSALFYLRLMLNSAHTLLNWTHHTSAHIPSLAPCEV